MPAPSGSQAGPQWITRIIRGFINTNDAFELPVYYQKYEIVSTV